MNFDAMKPEKISDIPIDTRYLYEIKYDGGSGFIVKKNNKVDIFHNGNNTPVTYRYPELVTNCLQYLKNGIYVSELIVPSNQFPNGDFDLFQKRQVENRFKINRRKQKLPVKAIIYDILHNGTDLKNDGLLKRKEILHKSVMDSNHIQVIESFKHPKKILDMKDTCEGIVIKELNSVYIHGKRTGWFKKRFNIERVVRFVDYEPTETGIVLLTEKQKRVNLAGKRSETARELINNEGYVDCEISFNKETGNGFRICNVKRLIIP
ncbi:MAG: ATP-dependent DNA ligase [Candidatus Thermoplasmatota archaeon]|nr:ATP-dependent DNA ligase [Candidatus Thermoplasmatota archaeon]